MLNVDQIGVDDDFFELGGDSLLAVQLFGAINKFYGLELGLSMLFDAPTIRQLATYIEQATLTRQSEPIQHQLIVPLQAIGRRLPLFWVPGGLGSSVREFKQISLLLGDDQPVYGFEVQPPEEDEELEGIEQRAKRLLRGLRLCQPNGPYQLIGFCGGGLVAFEMAQQLLLEGQQIKFLGIVDCVDPQHPRNWKDAIQFKWERAVWRAKQFLKRGPVGCVQQIVHRLKLAVGAFNLARLDLTRDLLGKRRPTTSEQIADHLEEKALLTARRYHPTVYGGSCTVFLGTDTYYYAGLRPSSDPRLIWCKLAKGGTDVRKLPGDHLTMLSEPNVFEFAVQLRPFLE
jgi:thioesterase domain-containing protein/acyl carrier protein